MAVWTDKVARQFTQVYWQPYEAHLRETDREMQQLTETIDRAKRGCAD